METVFNDELTGDSISVTKLLDGNKNTVYVVSGDIKSETDSTYSIIKLEDLVGIPKSLKLDSLAFAVQNGLLCLISYRDKKYTIPLEGKGKMELDTFGGLPGHEIDLTLKGTGVFTIFLDISKLGV
jgi:hypothetical protein